MLMIVEVGLYNIPQWGEFPSASIGEEDIDPTFLLLYRGVQAVKVCKI
jgi:hypothetical protein